MLHGARASSLLLPDTGWTHIVRHRKPLHPCNTFRCGVVGLQQAGQPLWECDDRLQAAKRAFSQHSKLAPELATWTNVWTLLKRPRKSAVANCAQKRSPCGPELMGCKPIC